ncbi:MAG: hypothetical protein HC888_00450 [Candidatus Competibacteraceae bacterium]|nr:hypothetical protein [Candidatus Competibacteraceae bacterium]
MNWPFIINEANKGKLMKASFVQDGTIHTYWADGQDIYKKTTDEYDAPLRWPIQNAPIVCPKIVRCFGFRPYPQIVVNDQVVSGNTYYYQAYVADVEDTQITATAYFPPNREGIESVDIEDVNVYAAGIFMIGVGNQSFTYARTVGDGEEPVLTLDDIDNPDPWFQSVIGNFVAFDALDYDPSFPDQPEVTIFDVNPDWFASNIGETVGSQIFFDSSARWLVSQDRYIDSGDINLKFLNQLCPRIEDTEDPNLFFGNNVLNLMVFNFINYAGEFEERTEYTPSDIIGEPFLAGLISRFSQFKGYRTLIWVDEGIAEFAQDVYSDPQVPIDQTDEIEGSLIQICDQMADYGFVYTGPD